MHRSLALWPFVQFFRVTRAVVGDLSWKPPGWMMAASRRPFLWGGLFLVTIILAVTGWRVWDYYAHLPKPPTITWNVWPDGTRDATVTFGGSVARLDLIGKDVTQLVTLSPKMPGKWQWLQGDRLYFSSSKLWPAGTDFTVTFAPDLFSRHA